MNDIITVFSNIISILTTGISLFIAFLCWVNGQQVNKSGNRWLGIFMLCIFLDTANSMLDIAGIKIEDAIIDSIFGIPASIFAPAFYFAVSYFITPDRPWKIKDYFHFWLAILYLLALAYAILYFDSLQDTQSSAILTINSIFIILYCINAFYYCALSWIKLKKHQKNILLFTSTIENVDLRWLKYIVVCVVVMFCFFIISEILNILPFHYDTIIQLFYLIGFFIIGYYFIKQKEIYPFTIDQKNEIIYTVIKETSEKQASKKLIEEDRLEELKAALLRIMENDKPFLDCELNLVKLAAMGAISSHQLSYLINKGFNENFYQFINRYRIEEAKKLILDKKMNYLNFQQIGFEVGFNSKSAFNVTFKKSTGQTPSEYRSKEQAALKKSRN